MANSAGQIASVDSRYRAAADLLDGYVHESRFLHRDQSPDHRIIWASHGFEAVFGCTVDEYNERAIWGGFYHPDDTEAARSRAARLRRGETVDAEVRLIRKNGEIRWLYVKNQPVFDPLAGEVVGVLGVGQDITRRKLIEEALRTHGIVLETMQEGVLLFDSEGSVSLANGAARRMFRLDSEDLTGICVSQFGIRIDFSADPRAAASEQICRRSDGSQFLAEVDCTPLALQARCMSVAVVHDCTAQRQLEQAVIEVANREQNRIATDLHDGLGQELTGAALMLRSLADKMTSALPEATPRVEEIIALVNGAIQGVRSLALGLSPVDLERGDLPAALHSLAARTQRNSPICVEFDCRGGGDLPIAADVANHLYRIAQEAVFNAVRHSGAANVKISLMREGGCFELKIEDDGCGILHPDASQLGMGLRIIQYRARMIGARASIEKGAQAGTAVTCRKTPAR